MATKKATKGKGVSKGAVPALPFLEELHGGPLTLGEVLSEARRVAEKSLEAFAEPLGVSRSHLLDIEKGRRGVSPARAAQWAKILRLSPERLIAAALQAQLDEAGIKMRVEVHAA
jgi:transcriptional regulator with XRE-family HTH domain